MTEHTKLPWIAQEATDGAWFIWNSNGGISTKDLIMSCVGRVNPDHRDSKVAAADAAFIVRACNSHDELVAALRRVTKALDQVTGAQYDHDASEAGWAAIAKAEGK